MKLKSQFFTLEELTRSNYAQTHHLTNLPNAEQTANLQALCLWVLDPLRTLYGHPIYVNSGYRCPQVNKAVGGVAGSQHCLGQAADITTRDAMQNRLLLGIILSNPRLIHFDQAIAEKCDNNGCPRWIHISWAEKQRSQVLYK